MWKPNFGRPTPSTRVGTARAITHWLISTQASSSSAKLLRFHAPPGPRRAQHLRPRIVWCAGPAYSSADGPQASHVCRGRRRTCTARHCDRPAARELAVGGISRTGRRCAARPGGHPGRARQWPAAASVGRRERRATMHRGGGARSASSPSRRRRRQLGRARSSPRRHGHSRRLLRQHRHTMRGKLRARSTPTMVGPRPSAPSDHDARPLREPRHRAERIASGAGSRHLDGRFSDTSTRAAGRAAL